MLFELCLVAVWCRCSISMRMECTILYELFLVSVFCLLVTYRINVDCWYGAIEIAMIAIEVHNSAIGEEFLAKLKKISFIHRKCQKHNRIAI